MSGNLRNALAMAFTRQQQRVNDAQTFLANNGNYTKARENEGLVLIGKLETSHREYDGIDKNWQALIATINDADEKDAEQKVYDQHAFDISDPQKVPFNKIMADILEAASDIKVECNIIQQNLAAVALPVAPVVATTPSVIPATTITIPSQIVLLNNPGPETKQRLYKGDPEGYKGFIEDWDSTVGNRTDITNVVKLQLLKQRLDGPAFDAVHRFNTDAGYAEALKKLKQRFGRDQDAISILLKKLELPVKDKSDLDAVRKAFDDFEFYLTTLGSYGVDMEAAIFKISLQKKLPVEIRFALANYERGLASGDATVTEYRKEADLILADFQRIYGKFLPQNQESNKQYSSGRVVASVTNSVGRNQQLNLDSKKLFSKLQCGFCEGFHKSEDCLKCTTLDEAKKLAKVKKLCFKCFDLNHTSKSCDRKMICKICEKNHHSHYCKKKRTLCKRDKKKEVPDAVKKSGNEETILITKEVMVSNPQNPAKRQYVLVFVDPGSQVNLVDEKLSKSLNLHAVGKAADFHGPDGKKFSAGKSFALNLHLADGSFFPVNAHGTPDMVKKVLVPKIAIDNCESHANKPLPVTTGNPKLLLSMKEFEELILHEKRKKLKNGFSIIRSKIGKIICGNGPVEGPKRSDLTQIVATIVNQQSLEKAVINRGTAINVIGEVDNPNKVLLDSENELGKSSEVANFGNFFPKNKATVKKKLPKFLGKQQFLKLKFFAAEKLKNFFVENHVLPLKHEPFVGMRKYPVKALILLNYKKKRKCQK